MRTVWLVREREWPSTSANSHSGYDDASSGRGRFVFAQEVFMEETVQEVSAQEGYALWARVYDEEKNTLIAVEEPYVEPVGV